jgi:hypothetical protein
MKLFAIRDREVVKYPVLEYLLWPDSIPVRMELAVYTVTERHDNWQSLIMFADVIDEIEYDPNQIADDKRNRVDQKFIGRVRPKY